MQHQTGFNNDHPADLVALEPEIPIIDAHHHFYDEPGMVYGAQAFAADTRRGHNIVSSVFVEAGQRYRLTGPEGMKSVGETEFAVAAGDGVAASGGPKLAAVVAGIDLHLVKQVDAVLDAHENAARGLLRGVRLRVAYDPAKAHIVPNAPQLPHRLADLDLRRSAAHLGRRDLALDLVVFFHQLHEVVGFAATAPDTKIVIDHIGYPLGIGVHAGRRREVNAEWRRNMGLLAQSGNVIVKVGGFGMRHFGHGWHGQPSPASSHEIVERVGPDVAFVIDTFGPSRCMFESNFPVDRMSFGYVTCWNAFKKMSKQYSPTERAALFRGTAMSAYRL